MTKNVTSTNAMANIVSPLPASEVIDRLERRAQQGKLPGFARQSENSCKVLVFAGMFDHEMTLSMRTQGATTVVEPSLRMLRRMPTIIWVVLALSLYPGLPITDSMMRVYFGWYDAWSGATWWWYVPMTLLAVPAVLKQMKSARIEARIEGGKKMEEIAKVVES